MGWIFPYALVIVNALVAFLIGLFAALLIYKSSLSEEYRAALFCNYFFWLKPAFPAVNQPR
jgi:fluoride ion exporter CrcB/FEX